ncbi:MAG: universal stress protein [Burkholderiaceae bacterium]|nr:universal stress protein [Burkholderiaceae bacterium]
MAAQSVAMPHKSGTASTVIFPDVSYRRVCACVDRTALARRVVWHAAALARSLGAELVLLHVVEANPGRETLSDPIEWALRREQARLMLEQLARDCASDLAQVRIQVLEGRAAEQICQWGHTNAVDLTVACTHGAASPRDCDLGSTIRAVVECATGSLLIVPAGVPDAPVAAYKRMVVPLDGSSRAESALPLAIRLAAATGGTIQLVHAVPEPGLTVIGPLTPEDIELRERIAARNERVAREYLNRIRERIAGRPTAVRTLLLRGGDARRALCKAIDRELGDLIVLASHGHGGDAEMATGSVASHLLARASLPLLVVRFQPHEHDRVRTLAQRRHARFPERASA